MFDLYHNSQQWSLMDMSGLSDVECDIEEDDDREKIKV